MNARLARICLFASAGNIAFGFISAASGNVDAFHSNIGAAAMALGLSLFFDWSAA